jgi:hypothetical protein
LKTIIRKSDNVSLYIYENSRVITLDADGIKIADSNDGSGNIDTSGIGSYNHIEVFAFHIREYTDATAEIKTNVTPPSDWVGLKYTFDGSNWATV